MGIPCVYMKDSIADAWELFVWPLAVIASGYLLGLVAARATRVSPSFLRPAAGAIAFGNNNGIAVALLQIMGPSLLSEGIIVGDPILYMSLYLVLAPLLQYGFGPFIFGGQPQFSSSGDGESACEGCETTPSPRQLANAEIGLQTQYDRAAASAAAQEVSRPESGPALEAPRQRSFLSVLPAGASASPPVSVKSRMTVRLCMKICNKAMRFAIALMSPHVIAVFAGLVVTMVRPVMNQMLHLHEENMTDFQTLDWIYISLHKFGRAFMLASNDGGDNHAHHD